MTKHDPHLAQRIRNGDHEAFKEFFDDHFADLTRYLSRLGLSEADRQDIVQQAFVAVWNNRARIDQSQSLRAYLFRAGRNAGFNLIRSRGREEAHADEEAIPSVTESEDPLASDADKKGHLTLAIAAGIATLPPRTSEVFQLCFVDGLTYKEAADVLTISPKTVENQMGRALKGLRSFLASYPGIRNTD